MPSPKSCAGIRTAQNFFGKKKKDRFPVGSFVKKAFTWRGRTERMWVRVDTVDERDKVIHGTLDNAPAIEGSPWHIGDRVPVRFSEVISKMNSNPSASAAGRAALKVYDKAGNLVGQMLSPVASLPRKWAGSLVGEKNGKRGKGRMNPAGDLYESFHGKPSEGATIVQEEFIERDKVETLGVLVNFKVQTLSGFDMQIGTPDAEGERMEFDEMAADENSVFLAASPDGKQLYFKGGDQSFPLDKCKMGESSSWYRDDMVIGVLYEITYRTRKKFDKFVLTDYFHHLGEETGDQPMLRYDTLSKHLFVTGGKYKIKMPLIGMSPGIEN